MQNKELIGQQEQVVNKKAEMVDVGIESRNELPHEVKDWMEKVEENNKQSDLISDVYNQSQAQVTKAQDDTTKIPISKPVFKSGFKKKVSEAGRWLSEFFLRMIKIKKGKVEFADNDN